MYKDRREWVRQQLMQRPFVSYGELFSQFPNVSQMTLRRDIDYLEKTGEAIKVRGGARSARFLAETMDDPYFSRMSENVESKRRIAAGAVPFLEAGRSIFFDSGSTLQQMIPCVPDERFVFTTTSPAAAIELSRIGRPVVNLVGGWLDRDYQAVSGMQAMKYLEDVNIDIAFLSPSGLSVQSGFTGGNYNECQLKKAVVEKARLVVMLMDLSKADKSLPYTFCRLDQVQVLLCDGSLPEQLQMQAAACDVRVIDVTTKETGREI